MPFQSSILKILINDIVVVIPTRLNVHNEILICTKLQYHKDAIFRKLK